MEPKNSTLVIKANSVMNLLLNLKENVCLYCVIQIFVVLAIISVGYDKMSPIKYFRRDLRMWQHH